MDLRQKLHLVVYRVREKGLEIFVREGDAEAYELPEANDGITPQSVKQLREDVIALESVEDNELQTQGIAIEADYHDIPSLKGLLLDDARRLRSKLKELPTAEEGSFVAVKELAKRALPAQYCMLQELRDILVDRNSTKYM